MKILFTKRAYARVGGSESLAYQFATRLADRGHEVRVVDFAPEQNADQGAGDNRGKSQWKKRKKVGTKCAGPRNQQGHGKGLHHEIERLNLSPLLFF